MKLLAGVPPDLSRLVGILGEAGIGIGGWVAENPEQVRDSGGAWFSFAMVSRRS